VQHMIESMLAGSSRILGKIYDTDSDSLPQATRQEARHLAVWLWISGPLA